MTCTEAFSERKPHKGYCIGCAVCGLLLLLVGLVITVDILRLFGRGSAASEMRLRNALSRNTIANEIAAFIRSGGELPPTRRKLFDMVPGIALPMNSWQRPEGRVKWGWHEGTDIRHGWILPISVDRSRSSGDPYTYFPPPDNWGHLNRILLVAAPRPEGMRRGVVFLTSTTPDSGEELKVESGRIPENEYFIHLQEYLELKSTTQSKEERN